MILAKLVSETEIAPRRRLADKLDAIPRSMMAPYIETSMEDGAWFKVKLLQVRYFGVIQRAFELKENDEIEKAVDLCRKKFGKAEDMFDAHAMLAVLMLRDMREPLWDTVEMIQQSAHRALAVAHWSDDRSGVETVRKLMATPAETMAQGIAAERALAFLEDNGQEAMKVLWQAYPGHRQSVYSSPGFQVSFSALASLEPRGRAFYAFAFARVIRTTCIAWYNVQQPTSQYEAMNLQSTARKMGSSAHRWATYAMSCLDRETLSPPMVEQIHGALKDLLAAFGRDAAALL